MNKLDIEDGGHSRPHHSDWRRFSPRAAPRLPTVDTGGRAQPRVCEPGHLARPPVAALRPGHGLLSRTARGGLIVTITARAGCQQLCQRHGSLSPLQHVL